MASLLLDELQIKRLRERWAFGRDYADWNELAQCFHSDSLIDISWYKGNVSGFIEGAKKSNAHLKPEERVKHWIGNSRVWIQGDRGVAEVDVNICTRNYIDGYLFDFTSRARFYDLVDKRDGNWKIYKWGMIYDVDRMDPVFPAAVPVSFYEKIDLTPFPGACAYLCFRLAKAGRQLSKNIVCCNSPEEAALKAEGRHWLTGSQPRF